MSANQNKRFPLMEAKPANGGFTLVELLIGMLVVSIVITAVYATFNTSRKTAVTQRQVADMQEQLRGSMYILGREIMAAGYDPTGVGNLGITDVRRYNIPLGLAGLDGTGSPVLTISFDTNSDGVTEQSTFLIYDIDSDGVLDLARTTDGTTYDLLAEGVQDVGFAYAFDNDNDGSVDLDVNGNIIWAVDSNNDNKLDRSLDVDNNGVIDNSDLTATIVTLAPTVPVANIRMVRVWLLCRSISTAYEKLIDSRSYIVGDRIIPAANDTYRRRTLEMTVNCRNLG